MPINHIRPAITRQLEACGVTWADAHLAAVELGFDKDETRWTMGELARIITRAEKARPVARLESEG